MASKGHTFYDAYLDLLDKVMKGGRRCSPRGMEVLELLHTQLLVTNLRNNVLVHPVRDLNYRFMVLEWLWIEAGQNDVETVSRYNKQIAQYSDDGEIFNGAYGPRLASQWDWLTGLMERDNDTRQGVVSIWTPCPKDSKDIPCTLSLQLLLRDDTLHGIVTMRSQDLWLGLPYDFFNFSQIVNGLAGQLKVRTGSLCFNVGSSHVYAKDFEKVQQLLHSRGEGFCIQSPTLKRRPPAKHIINNPDYQDFNHEEEYYVRVLHDTKKKAEAKIELAMAWLETDVVHV